MLQSTTSRWPSPLTAAAVLYAANSLNRSSEALEFLEHARKLDPKSPVPLYHKATILHDFNRPQEELEILEELVNPRNVLEHFLMKKLYQKLGKNYEAKHTPH